MNKKKHHGQEKSDSRAKALILCLTILILLASFAIAGTDYLNSISGNNISIGNDNIFIDETNNRVGIKTTAPKADLHVNGSRGMIVTPYNLTHVSSKYFPDINAHRGTAIQGKYLYVGVYTNLYILDISNPAFVNIVGRLFDVGLMYPEKLEVHGKYAYSLSTASEGKLVITDISNPSAPRIVGQYRNDSRLISGSSAGSLYMSGRYAYVPTYDYLNIIDISNSSNPKMANSMQYDSLSASDIKVQGRYAYVSSYDYDFVTIIDVSNPLNPVYVGNYTDTNNLDGANSLYVSGSYAYVTAANKFSISILNISNPSSPQLVGTYSNALLENPKKVVVYGKYALVISSKVFTSYIHLFDISNVSNIRLIGSYIHPDTDSYSKLEVSGKYVYILTTGAKILVLSMPSIGTDAASIGDLATDNLDVSDNTQVGNDMYVGNGLFVGPGGLYADAGNGIASDGNMTVWGSISVNTQTHNNTLDVNGFIEAAGSDSITSAPPMASTNVGWKLGFWSNGYALGVAEYTLALYGYWWSIFNSSTLPADNANANVPDSNSNVAFKMDGKIFSRKLVDRERPTGYIDLWNGTGSTIHFGTDPWGGGYDEAWIVYKNYGGGETTELQIGTSNDADDDIALYNSGADRLTIQSGVVGMHTESPTAGYALHVNENVFVTPGWLRIAGANALRFSTYDGGWIMTDPNWIQTTGSVQNVYHRGDTTDRQLRTDNELYVGSSGSRFIVKSDGKTGIGGVTSPTALLAINGAGAVNDTLYSQGSAGCYAHAGYDDGYYDRGINAYAAGETTAYGIYGYATGGTTDYGVFGSGSTAGFIGYNLGDGTIRMAVLGGAIYGSGAIFQQGSNYLFLADDVNGGTGMVALGSTYGIYTSSAGAGLAGYFYGGHVRVTNSGAPDSGDITNNGDMYASGSLEVDGYLYLSYLNTDSCASGYPVYYATTGQYLYRSSSSARYKKDIVPFEDDFSKVLIMEPISFNYKEGHEWDMGYLAESVDLIGLEKLVEYDNESLPYTVKYDKLPIYEVEVLKEQNKDIAAGKNEIDELKTFDKIIDNLVNVTEQEMSELEKEIEDIKVRLAALP